MAKVIHLDTHVVIWLYSGDLNLIPRPVIDMIETNNIEISPIAELELQHLYEIKRISVKPGAITHALGNEIGLKKSQSDLDDIVAEAMKLSWTRDPFDRIIVATASLGKHKLITKDELILKHYKYARWE